MSDQMARFAVFSSGPTASATAGAASAISNGPSAVRAWSQRMAQVVCESGSRGSCGWTDRLGTRRGVAVWSAVARGGLSRVVGAGQGRLVSGQALLAIVALADVRLWRSAGARAWQDVERRFAASWRAV